MAEPFHDKLALALKALTLTRADVAMALRVDKSLVGRWATGKAMPSAHNLSRLTAMVAERTGRFTMLDWERSLPDISQLLGVEPARLAVPPPAGTLTLPANGHAMLVAPEMLQALARRGPSYEGFYRTIRPFSDLPGRFAQSYVMIRLESDGLYARSRMGPDHSSTAQFVPIRNQVYVYGMDIASGLPFFGIINGSNGGKVVRYDGLLLYAAHDGVCTPFATPLVSERIADLTGDRDADDAQLEAIGLHAGLAPEGSVSPEIRAYLLREVGPSAFALGGELLMSLPPGRSLALAHLPPEAE